MSGLTIGQQIWWDALKKAIAAAQTAALPDIAYVMVATLQRSVITAIDELDASFRADLDATEEHYRREPPQ